MSPPEPRATAYQRQDSYYQRAKREGFRSRAAYKLQEIQRRHGLLRPGQRVLDLGCWPGGWMQVAASIVGPQGVVVGVDVAPLDPPLNNENAIALCADLEDPETPGVLRDALGGPADVLLSDAAPKLTGVRPTDRAREERLLLAVETLLTALLAPGGSAVVKLLESPEAQQVARRLRTRFAEARIERPRATRRGSSEHYLVARGFRSGPAPGGEP